jgi:hypothetical protein
MPPSPARPARPGGRREGVCRASVLRIALVACLTAVAVIAVSPPGAAHADEGLEVASTYTYTVDPAANVVHVVADLLFTNTVPNRRDGDVINQTYFSGFALPLPVEAIDVAATQEGAALSVTPEFLEGVSAFFRLGIDFSSNLFYDSTARVLVTYDIGGQVPRSELPSRVNGAYTAFNAYGIGDAGNLTVRVVVPPGYQIDTLGGDAVITEEDGNTVYTASAIDQPEDFDLFVSARNDAALVTQDVLVGDIPFQIRAWPGDTEWIAFVSDRLQRGVPALQAAIGQEWPLDQSVEVREAFTPYLYGYAGWFDPDNRELEIGEDLDSQTIVHELSHGWFNRNWFAERWINEGLAQEYADLVDEQLGAAAADPEPVDPASAGALPLVEWQNPEITDGADETEAYAYNASWSVIDQIVDEIGPDAMRAFFAAVADDTIAYTGDRPAEDSIGGTDWRRLLDLFDQVGGATVADGAFSAYVLTPDQVALLPARAEAVQRYDALEASGADWAPPLAVRTEMASWDFDEAQQMIDAAEVVLRQRADVEALLQTIGVTLAGDADAAELAYEAAAYDLDDATAALADTAVATHVVIDAIAYEAQDHPLYNRIGLQGVDLHAMIDGAKAALATGDNEAAIAAADELVRTIDGSAAAGRREVLRTILGVSAGIVGGAVLIILLITVMRRRRRTFPARRSDPAATL